MDDEPDPVIKERKNDVLEGVGDVEEAEDDDEREFELDDEGPEFPLEDLSEAILLRYDMMTKQKRERERKW